MWGFLIADTTNACVKQFILHTWTRWAVNVANIQVVDALVDIDELHTILIT